jgi:hypothetical protein
VNLEILQPSALLPEDAALPAAKRLSVLAAEAMGYALRRRPHPQATAVFEWLDEHWGERRGVTAEQIEMVANGPERGPQPGQRWIRIPDYASDVSAAEHIITRALELGYVAWRESIWQQHQRIPSHRVSFRWLGRFKAPAPPALPFARATDRSPAQATTLAFLQLTGRIGALEEESCPTP